MFRPCFRRVCTTVMMRAAKREPRSLWAPKLFLRQRTNDRSSRSAWLCDAWRYSCSNKVKILKRQKIEAAKLGWRLLGRPHGRSPPTKPRLAGRECTGRNDEMNDRLRPRKTKAPSAEPAQYWRRQQVTSRCDQEGAPLGGVKATARAQGHGLKQGRAPRPAEKHGGSKVAARAARRSAVKARAWRKGS